MLQSIRPIVVKVFPEYSASKLNIRYFDFPFLSVCLTIEHLPYLDLTYSYCFQFIIWVSKVMDGKVKKTEWVCCCRDDRAQNKVGLVSLSEC